MCPSSPIITRALLYLPGIVVLFLGCNKAVVNFGSESLNDDPNMVYIDTMTIGMFTLQTDSFATSADTLFMTGVYKDSLLGRYEARAFMQIGVPESNALSGCTNCSLDSLVFTARFSGSYTGDTTAAYTLQVHRLSSQMIADESPVGYNVSNMPYNETPSGSLTIAGPKPTAQGNVTVKMDQPLATALFDMLKRNSDTITNGDLFYKYFNGIALRGSAAAEQTIYYFTNATAGSAVVMQLYYHQNGSTAEQHSIDFPIAPASFQFNIFTYDKSSAAVNAFTPKKKQVIAASLTHNKIFLHNNSGLFPYFSLPALSALKELHPYIKVVKAELEIIPDLSNYAAGSGFRLPPALALYQVDEYYNFSAATYDAAGSSLQTGNLVVDYLYHRDTKYTYDLTDYVNAVLTYGDYYQKPLALIPFSNAYENRLVLNSIAGSPSVIFKLYVLGL